MERKAYSVSEINAYLKDQFDRDSQLSGICLYGEISNYKLYPSGHHYFSLKDAASSIRCVMFRGSAARLRFRPENGMQVLVQGRIAVFLRDGVYQVYCEAMLPKGTGDLYVAFEQLKAKLQAAGMFELDHKKRLPVYPERIAIVTSPAGAAIHDMLRILGRRYPLAKVIILPVRVQGQEAPEEICRAIRYANHYGLADVIITGRGGGSIEDLWAFNHEEVARAIYDSRIPVISAVGHEPDITISDYVADLRAATPSNAAELAVPDQMELRQGLHVMGVRMQQAMEKRIQCSRQRLKGIQNCRMLQSPVNYLLDKRIFLDHIQKQLLVQMRQHIMQKKEHLIRYAAGMDAMSPLKVLARGYSVAKDETGKIISRADQLAEGDSFSLQLMSGSLRAEVLELTGESKYTAG